MIKINQIFNINAHSGAIYKLAPAHEEHLFYSAGGDQFVARWNLKTGEQDSFAAKLNQTIYTLNYNKKTHLLFCGTTGGSVHIIDVQNNKEIKNLKPSNAPIFTIHFINDYDLLIIGDGAGNLHFYKATNFTFIKTINIGTFKIRDLAYHNNKIWIACGNGNVLAIDAENQTIVHSFNAHSTSTNKILFIDNLLYTGSSDAHLNKWDQNLNLIASTPLHNYAIYDIAAKKEENIIVSASRDKTIKITDLNTHDFLYRIDKEKNNGHSLSVNTLLWTNFNNYLISAGDDRKIMVWQIEK